MPEQASGAARSGGDVADVEQIARMRHQQMIGIAAGAEHADAERRAAKLLVAALADRAFAAAEPWMNEPAVARLDALGVWADGDDFADVFVSHGQRQLDAAVGELEQLAAAEIVVALPDMQIAVADAGGDDLEQDLGPRGLRRRPLHQPQRCPAFTDIIAFHRT